MKAKHILSALALIAATALTSSCNQLVDKALQAAMEAVNHDYQDSEKWGNVTTLSIPALAFQQVELSAAIRLEYTQDRPSSTQV